MDTEALRSFELQAQKNDELYFEKTMALTTLTDTLSTVVRSLSQELTTAELEADVAFWKLAAAVALAMLAFSLILIGFLFYKTRQVGAGPGAQASLRGVLLERGTYSKLMDVEEL